MIDKYKYNDQLYIVFMLQETMRSSSKYNKTQDTQVHIEKLSDRSNQINYLEHLNNDVYISSFYLIEKNKKVLFKLKLKSNKLSCIK